MSLNRPKSMRIVQFLNDDSEQQVALVDDQDLRVIDNFSSTFALARAALDENTTLNALIDEHAGDTICVYDEVLREGRILSPVMHPDPSRLWVTGTGLTHLGSAAARDSMHSDAEPDAGQTDSMKMFQMGIRAGKPAAGEIGVQPEWFYKGNGSTVVAPEAPMYSPSFALLDGDEIEICVCYIIAENGTPCRNRICARQ